MSSSSGFSFPEMTPAQIAEALHSCGIAPSANLRAEDVAHPQHDLLPSVLSLFLASVGCELDGGDGQLGFEVLDNPEHHDGAIQVIHLYKKARDFLDSINCKEFTLRDLLFPNPRRVAHVLSAVINFLYYRDEKVSLMQPIVDEFPASDERRIELKAKIDEHQKAIVDHELAAQMEEPMVQQLEVEVNALRQKIQDYNKEQMALRTKAKAISDKKEDLRIKISQADSELMKITQEKLKLESKVVQSPEKLQRALEEKKSVRAELKNFEKMAMQSVQEKTATLEKYSKAHEKLEKHFSMIQALQEQVSAAKTAEKEVKARKAKLSDNSVSIKNFDAKIVEWQGKVHEMEKRLKEKEKERDKIITDENQKLGALRSEIELKLQGLETGEKKVEAKITKAANLCSEVDSVKTAASAKQQEIYAKFEEIGHTFNYYMETINSSLEQVEEVSKATLVRIDASLSCAGC